MATLGNKRKFAAVARDNQEGSLRNSQSRNSRDPRINEENFTQVSEEIEGRVTKKLSQEFSRTESPILGGLSKLDEFILNSQVRVQSGTVRGTSRNMNLENQEPTDDRSQNDPEVDTSIYRSTQSMDSDPEETFYSSITKSVHHISDHGFKFLLLFVISS